MQGNLFSGLNLSHEDKVLTHLVKYGKINGKECKRLYGFDHCSSHIRNLRRKGFNIKSLDVVGVKPSGNRTYHVDYALSPKQPLKINKMLETLKRSLNTEREAV